MKLILGTLGVLLILGCDQEDPIPTSRVVSSNTGGTHSGAGTGGTGGAAPTALLTHCSDDIEDQVSCALLSDAGRCQDRTNDTGCPLPWGCESFDEARVAVGSECRVGEPLPQAGTACGYRVIEKRTGHSGDRAFYDPNSGDLIGISSRDDNGPPTCSGDIPSECSDVGSSLEDAASLCDQPLEGGECRPIEWSSAVSVCSPDPLVVAGDNADGVSVSCREGCLLPWGCDDYDTARAALATCSDIQFDTYVTPALAARGCGYLTLVTIPRDPFQGFYDPDTKQLVAAFTEDDVGHVNCSGSLPMDCVLSYFSEPMLTDEEQLCEGGPVRDAGP